MLSITKDIVIESRREVTLKMFTFGRKVEPSELVPVPAGGVYTSLGANGLAKVTAAGIERLQPPAGVEPTALLMVGNDLWFGDWQSHGIWRMMEVGKFQQLAALQHLRPVSLCLGYDDRVWVATGREAKLVRLTRDGVRNDVDNRGSTLIASGLGRRIWSLTTRYLYSIDEEEDWERRQLPEGSPGQVVRGQDDTLWYTDFERRMLCNIINRNESIDYRLPGEMAAYSLAIDPNGSVWILSGLGTSFLNMRQDGVATEYHVGEDAALTHIAMASDGGLWFSEPHRYRVSYFAR